MINVQPSKNAMSAKDLETDVDKSAVFGICMDTLTQASVLKWSETDIASCLSTHFGRPSSPRSSCLEPFPPLAMRCARVRPRPGARTTRAPVDPRAKKMRAGGSGIVVHCFDFLF